MDAISFNPEPSSDGVVGGNRASIAIIKNPLVKTVVAIDAGLREILKRFGIINLAQNLAQNLRAAAVAKISLKSPHDYCEMTGKTGESAKPNWTRIGHRKSLSTNVLAVFARSCGKRWIKS